MSYDLNPYAPPKDTDSCAQVPPGTTDRRGPLLYFATAGIIAAIISIPLLLSRSMAVKDDPNPLGYLLILISFPVGGFVYRMRSRKWPVDRTVRNRQINACCATLLLPIAAALLTGMRGQGFHITVLSGMVSLLLMAGILISGLRRSRNVA
ncbi:hypothetical protein SH467x_003411 [Pirellulaceae bacterium SH467]